VTDRREDREFATFLAGKSDLADRYEKLAREEPPPELDAQILAAAREAAKVRRHEFDPRGGWLKPVALAATILLSFSLILNLVIEPSIDNEQIVTDTTETRAPATVERAAQEPGAPGRKGVLSVQQAETSPGKRPVDRQGAADKASQVTGYTQMQAPAAVAALHSPARPGNREAALQIVAAYLAASGRVAGRVAEPAVKPDKTAGMAETPTPVKRPPADDPESLLRKIGQLYAGGSTAEAGALLEAFLARYPDHPVSVKIRQQGY